MDGRLPPSKLEALLAWERRERLAMGVRMAARMRAQLEMARAAGFRTVEEWKAAKARR